MKNPLDAEGVNALVITDIELKMLASMFRSVDVTSLVPELATLAQRVANIDACEHPEFVTLVDASICTACGVMT